MPDTRRALAALQTLLADNTAGDISAQDVRDELISSHPEKISQSDTQANEPSSGQLAGDLFFPTNGLQIERYGSAWNPWGPIFPLTKPVDGDFAWINQGSATVTTTYGGINLRAPANASAQGYRIRKKTAPATPYTITAAFLQSCETGSSGQYFGGGLCFRQSSDGKVMVMQTDTNLSSVFYQGIMLRKLTDPSTLSANYFTRANPFTGPLVWMRIGDDGTNRKCWLSPDGQNWGTEIHSVGRTDFLTADEVGFCINPFDIPGSMTLVHWREA